MLPLVDKVLRALAAALSRRSLVRALEECERDLAALRSGRAAFLSSLAHELRTPLHVVLSNSAMLAETSLDAEQRARLDRVTGAARALGSTVEDLLELDRLGGLEERGGLARLALDTESKPFDPEDVIVHAAEAVAAEARDRGVDLLLRRGASLPALVHGDAKRLERVVLQLAREAVERASGGWVEITAEIAGASASEPLLELAVRSSPADAEASAPPSRSESRDVAPVPPGGGLAVGARLARRTIEALHGRLDDATDRDGRTLRVALPLAPEDRSGSGRQRSPAAEGRRVLVVSERAKVAENLAALARAEGALVQLETTAYAGFEAISRGSAIDVVVLDASLPGRDALLGGIETGAPEPDRRPRVILVHPVLGRRICEEALDEAVACQLAMPVAPERMRRALELPHEPSLAARPEATSDEPSGAVHALLADDDEANRQLLQYLLVQRGYRVDTASDGARAVAAFAAGRYDVVLMDCQMPGVDGLEATRRIRALERGRSRRTPILAMSAGSLEADVGACLAAGMDDHLAKPFQPSELLAWLEAWLVRSLGSSDGEVRGLPKRRVTAREAGLAGGADAARAVSRRRPAGGAAEGVSPVATPSEGALDRSVLGSLFDDDAGRAIAEELIAAFVAASESTLEGLRTELARGNLEEVARLAHRFVSTSGSVGAMRLARAMRDVESAARDAASGAGSTRAAAEVERIAGEILAARRAVAELSAGALPGSCAAPPPAGPSGDQFSPSSRATSGKRIV